MRQAHFHIFPWKAAVGKYTPELVLVEYCWENDEASKSLLSVTVPEGVVVAPVGVLKVISCGGQCLNLVSFSASN